MLKKRLVACLLIHNGIIVQSIGFSKYLPVGVPKIAVEFLNYWGIDEIVLIDMDASKEQRDPNYKIIKELSSKCRVPLTVGGGINNIEQIKYLMDCGADKISINNIAFDKPELITEAAKIYGNQCVVVSVDAIKMESDFFVYRYINKSISDLNAVMWCQRVEQLGAGEVFLTSVDRDGKYSGFELDLMKDVSDKLKIPVIASGGAGDAQHFVELFKKTSVSAASAANMLHFSEHAVNTLKAGIEKEINIRLDTTASYRDAKFYPRNRIQKKDEKFLEELLYVKIEKEEI